MADESFASASTSANNVPARQSSINGNAPPGHSLRRATTVGQPSALRRRSTLNPGSPSGEDGFPDVRRRSSTYSDFSLGDARRDLETSADELLNPSKSSKTTDQSPFIYVPLTLALLPALAGIFFENGSAFFTDLILLSLAAVFLHWSVTQPWDWYHSAQEVRIIKDEIMTESVFESDSDIEPLSPTTERTTLDNVPEETEKQTEPEVVTQKPSDRRTQQWKERQAAALSELYLHEIAALAWCFIFPMLGAYLLHTIRGQLSRPSEGLVSDYNLTIFLCAAEIRPVSHLIRMLQNRTLRVQQIVAKNPYEKQTVTMEQLQELSSRLNELETRGVAGDATSSVDMRLEPPQQKLIEATVAQEFRSSVQPELDALSRAMRRYEKKLTLLACQTDNRVEYVDHRLNDAIALAAVAAKNSNSQWSFWTWFIKKTMTVVMLPVQALVAVSTFPFRTVSTLLGRKSRSTPERTHRSTRTGKTLAQGRNGLDRVPTRMSRR
ncbi:uncharacterized protein F4807DRAFT_415716 [Annulohypoxylon truncatum]|uniref:uncharacterized protein n=1 Tax=Annulohypoxylon truncatum TaxID=327061 RepID=UPI0020079CA8|nr:uncharacterized protein F4807DRAFT_415716 [Annulohypoxylon truncatum]KAI1212362.1 hypothetical protein F4807DRAFT_415716 [Annulohypoxylon truncatum]